MINREMAALALERMEPEAQALAHAEAHRREVPAQDIVLEHCLEQVSDQLYALKRREGTRAGRPTLRIVQ